MIAIPAIGISLSNHPGSVYRPSVIIATPSNHCSSKLGAWNRSGSQITMLVSSPPRLADIQPASFVARAAA
ncbi:hypothetical protein P1X14_03800 [Sphingomonas sp. AOB5]|uniref:hypothetical protein n=1 Tax=Sphingomonas sp. AOB5 TaxID=3034017 RepID=UPI0023F8C119|nr:hypothetical protein [Sphingomonas sp. AOB5]MDF7774359.1 hypothetical protein [Sphingomonas sp. AOB5]